jgi:parallel beta-helix repeat protein
MPWGLEPFALIRNDTVWGWFLDFVCETMTEFKSHDCIERWVMMNEPRLESGHEAQDEELFYQRWTQQRENMTGIDSRPITIQLALGNSPWSGDFNSTRIFQLCDYIAINEYLDPRNSSDTKYGGNWTTFNDCVSECQDRQVPLVISEFGMNTSTLEDRAVYYRESLSLFKSKGIQRAYAFAWQATGIESYNINGTNPPTPQFLELVRADRLAVPDDCATIQVAIDNANEGDTVFVRNGTYYEHVVVNKTISLVGESNEGTVLNSTDTDPMIPIMTVEADNVKISGFTFEGWSFNNIRINATTGVVIVGNKIVFNAIGILVENSVNITMDDNVLEGFGLDNIGIMLDHSSECKMTNNTIANAVYDGVRLWFSNNNLLSHNIFANNDYGIFVHGSNRNTVSKNTISESGGPGMYFEESSSNNVIVHNNFVDNWTPVGFWDSSANVWDNGCEGNYWSDYSSNDSDHDGVGDLPYAIDSNNKDHYPLMNPYWIPADVNHDLEINIFDVVRITGAYSTTPASPNWNPHADIAQPFGKIDIFDIVLCTGHYGKKYP